MGEDGGHLKFKVNHQLCLCLRQDPCILINIGILSLPQIPSPCFVASQLFIPCNQRFILLKKNHAREGR